MMPRSQVTHERLVKDKGRPEERSITTPYATRTTTRITATETAVFHLLGDCLPDFNGISWLHARPFVRLTLALSRAERAQRAREAWPSNATPGRRLERVVRHHRFPASVSSGLLGMRPNTIPTTTPRPMSMRPRPGRLHTDQRPNRKQLTATMPPAIRDMRITMCLALSFVQRSLIAVGLNDG